MKLRSLVFRNIHRHRRSFGFSMVGIVVGVTSFIVFLALGEGLRQNVLEQIYVVNQIEVVPRTYDLGGFQGEGGMFGGGTGMDDFTVDDLRALPGVVAVYPKMQLAFPGMAHGGEEIFGRRLWTELIADGVPADLVAAELPVPDDPNNAFRDWEGAPIACTDPNAAGVGTAVGCPAGHICNAQSVCEPTACNPPDEVLAAPTRGQVERVRSCLLRRISDRSRAQIQFREIPEELRAEDEPYPFRLIVAPSYLDEARRVLTEVLPEEPPAPEPEPEEADESQGDDRSDEGEDVEGAEASEPAEPRVIRFEPCDRVPSLQEVVILHGDELMCDDPPSYCPEDLRHCTMPVPVIASLFLFEIFNTNVQTVLSGSDRSMPRLTSDSLLGFTFDVTLGRGVLGSAVRLEDVGTLKRRFRLVGWSPRAMRLGVTIPLEYVRRYNTMFKGEDASEEYHSILVLTERSEDLAPIVDTVQRELGLSIDDAYEQAKRGSMMIKLLTLGLMFISGLIIFLASLNITHTFLMAIAERRREIGVLRSVGARRRDIRRLVLTEAGFIGLTGAAIAIPLAFGLASLADYLMVEQVPDFPFKPDSLFAFEPYILGAGIGIAVFFSLLGALVPAARAARMDPAEALRGD